MIETGQINVNAVLSASAPLSDGAYWFQRLYNKEEGLMKAKQEAKQVKHVAGGKIKQPTFRKALEK